MSCLAPQSLAGVNVSTTIRMTVVKLRTGGLWVHAPIAPTRCVLCCRRTSLARLAAVLLQACWSHVLHGAYMKQKCVAGPPGKFGRLVHLVGYCFSNGTPDLDS